MAMSIRRASWCASEGKPALGIGVVTAKGANILELGKDVAAATAEFMTAVPQGINVEQIADQPKVVEHAVSEFVHSFIEALAIVLFVSAFWRWAGAPASWWRCRCRWCWRSSSS